MKRRIAYVIWSLGLGGAEQVVIRLASSLDRERFDPVIFCLNEPGRFAGQAEDAGIPVVAFHKRHAVELGLVRALAAAFREHKIDIVHTHLWGANVWGRIAAWLAGVRHIVVTEHSVDLWKGRHHLLIDRLLVPATHSLVAVSEQVRAFYEDHGVGRGRWHVIHNGIDSNERPRVRGAAYAALGIEPDAPVVGLLGRIASEKAPEGFLAAVAIASHRIPKLRALVIGEGPLRAAAQDHARKLGIGDRTLFTGLREDVPELLAGMDVLASSSRTEGFSIAILEAMAAGVPVVATHVGGNPELVESGVTGHLVPEGDASALAACIVSIIQDPAAAARMSKVARQRVERQFSLDTMVATYERLYGGDGASP